MTTTQTAPRTEARSGPVSDPPLIDGEAILDGAAALDEARILAPERLIAEVGGSINLANAALVGLAADVLTSGEWCGSGIRSASHWLEWKFGLNRYFAGRVLVVAERRHELAAAFAHFGDGKLSLDQMFLIAQTCPAGFDQDVADLAIHATIPQLRQILRNYCFPVPKPKDPQPDDPDSNDPESGPGSESDLDSDLGSSSDCDSDVGPGSAGSDPNTPDSGTNGLATSSGASGESETRSYYRGMGYGFGDDGSFRLWLKCGPDEGAEIEAAMNQAKSWLSTDRNQIDVGGIDSFLALLRAGVEADPSESRRSANRVLLHVEVSDLQNGNPKRRPHLHLGPSVDPSTTRLLACDSMVQVLFKESGKPISLSRSQRNIPPPLREIVLDRDGSCRYPGCSSRRWLEVHHIRHWINGGLTEGENLVCLCGLHHRAHHRFEFGIEGNPEMQESLGALRFLDKSGREIKRLTPIGVPPPSGTYEHGSGERYDKSLVQFWPNEASAA